MEMEMIKNEVSVLTNKKLNKATVRINKLGEAIKKNTYEIAYTIAQVEKSKCYEDDGFKSVHDWTKACFGFKKTVSYRMLKIGNEYTATILASNGKITAYRSNVTPLENEEDYTPRQIEALIPGGHDLAVRLTEEGVISPAMTCRELSKAIKDATKEESDEDNESEENGDNDGDAVVSYTYDVLIRYGGKTEAETEKLGKFDDEGMQSLIGGYTCKSEAVDIGDGCFKFFVEWPDNMAVITITNVEVKA